MRDMEAEIDRLLYKLGQELDHIVPPGWSYNLLIFNAQDNNLFAISGGNKREVVKFMRKFLQEVEPQ